VLNRQRVEGATVGGAGVADPGPMARAFQESVVDVLSEKTARAAEAFGVRTVIVAGGVAANGALRAELQSRCTVPVRWPPMALCTDNAAMIGAAAFYRRNADPSLCFDLFSTSGPGVFQAGAG